MVASTHKGMAAAGTRERLIAAAGPVFAAKGFRDATIRDVCTRARANVAAVSYHFGDKLGLYRAVLEGMHEAEESEGARGAAPPATPEEQLRVWVRAFVLRILDDGRPEWQTRLMLREMTEPSPALSHVIRRSIRPKWDRLTGLVRAVLGPGASEDLIERCASSIVGQCLHYKHCRPIVRALHTTERFDARAVEALAEHVAAFSLAGIRGAAAEGGGR